MLRHYNDEPMAANLLGEGEDEEVAFAGSDDAEKAAVRRDGEIAEGDVVEDGLGRGLENGNVFAGLSCGERGDGNPDDVGGFSFGGALKQDAVFVRSPLNCAKADAQAGDVIGSGEVANLEDFAINEISDFSAAGGNGKAAGVAIESGELFVVLGEKLKILKARRAGL